MLQFRIREKTPEDSNMVVAYWLNSLRSDKLTSYIPSEFFFPNEREMINTLLKNSACLLAVSVDEPDLILSFLCYTFIEYREKEHLCIHYAYTKKLFQGFGIIKHMITHLEPEAYTKPIFISQMTEGTKKLMDENNFIFNPYLKLRGSNASYER